MHLSPYVPGLTARQFRKRVINDYGQLVPEAYNGVKNPRLNPAMYPGVAAALVKKYLYEAGLSATHDVKLSRDDQYTDDIIKKMKAQIHRGNTVVAYSPSPRDGRLKGQDGLDHVPVAVGYDDTGMFFHDPGGNYPYFNRRGRMVHYSYDFIRKNRIGLRRYYIHRK